jgi:hypothetical protein
LKQELAMVDLLLTNVNTFVDPVYGAKRPNTVVAIASLFMTLALQVNSLISKVVSDSYQLRYS